MASRETDMKNDKPEPDATDIHLAEMIQNLRLELNQAQEQAKDQDILFDIEKIELELKVAISRSATAKGGIAFHVINAGGEYEKSNLETNTFTITLNPISKKGRIQVADETESPLLR